MTAVPVARAPLTTCGVSDGLSSSAVPSAPGAPSGHNKSAFGGAGACAHKLHDAIARISQVFISPLRYHSNVALAPDGLPSDTYPPSGAQPRQELAQVALIGRRAGESSQRMDLSGA